jgi:hypothetical protein
MLNRYVLHVIEIPSISQLALSGYEPIEKYVGLIVQASRWGSDAIDQINMLLTPQLDLPQLLHYPATWQQHDNEFLLIDLNI